jgi:indolepyruvate ferredoxin oxidoreductase
MERALIAEYERTVEELLRGLSAHNHALAVEIASLPEEMRGFGHIKRRNVAAVRQKQDQLLHRWRAPQAERAAA